MFFKLKLGWDRDNICTYVEKMIKPRQILLTSELLSFVLTEFLRLNIGYGEGIMGLFCRESVSVINVCDDVCFFFVVFLIKGILPLIVEASSRNLPRRRRRRFAGPRGISSDQPLKDVSFIFCVWVLFLFLFLVFQEGGDKERRKEER